VKKIKVVLEGFNEMHNKYSYKRASRMTAATEIVK